MRSDTPATAGPTSEAGRMDVEQGPSNENVELHEQNPTQDL